jgi:predicted nucleotidyltransferase
MATAADVFLIIEKKIGDILPEASVSLFGSRATDSANEESDWDILIVTKNTPDKKLKRVVQEALFPLSLKLATFINIIIASENDWNNNPSYYSLQQSIYAQRKLA